MKGINRAFRQIVDARFIYVQVSEFHHTDAVPRRYTCSFIGPFLTACCSNVADLGNDEIHSSEKLLPDVM